MTKSKKWIRTKKAEVSRPRNLGQSRMFFTVDTRMTFTKLRQAFVEASILNHFDSKRHIQIEINALDYVIGRILSQLTLDDLSRWHPITFFLKRCLAKTWYETYNGELLAIVEAFKIWRHYLKVCKYEILVLTDHNNLQHFIDSKNLSSIQVWWA